MGSWCIVNWQIITTFQRITIPSYSGQEYRQEWLEYHPSKRTLTIGILQDSNLSNNRRAKKNEPVDHKYVLYRRLI